MEEEIKILCVDDEPNVLKALQRLFLDDDYEILTAASGQDGLLMLEKEKVQLVISDYRMPMMNGVEFLKEVRLHHPETVRIVLSGYADTAAIVSAINEGEIYKFIPKPWNDDELKVTVLNALERYFLYKENARLTVDLKKKNEELSKVNAQLEKLLLEKSNSLEFKRRALIVLQDVIDCIPLGILGTDLNNTAVLCNSIWQSVAGNNWCGLGNSIEEGLPGGVAEFIHEVRGKECGSVFRRIEINGIHGKLIGAFMDRNGHSGVITVFIPDEEMP
ncbi:MAG: response regulator [Nitrospiraceae bacterium]|nr:response regulator [Nitrospiraceae bacterium]